MSSSAWQAGLTLEEAVLLAHRENVPVDARFDALGDDSWESVIQPVLTWRVEEPE